MTAGREVGCFDGDGGSVEVVVGWLCLRRVGEEETVEIEMLARRPTWELFLSMEVVVWMVMTVESRTGVKELEVSLEVEAIVVNLSLPF